MPDDPIGWIEKEYYSTETKQPIELVPYQKATIREALRTDADGLFVYDTVVWGDIKKSAKSSIVGAVMLWRARHNNLEICRIVGNDLKQAASRTFQFIEKTITLNPRLKDVCKLKTNNITLPNDTLIQAIPVDPGGEAGGADLMIAFTEVWAYKNESHKTMWTEMGLSPLKFGRSQTWVESYAGYEGGSPILENLYAKIEDAELVDVGIPGLELYRHGGMLILWNTIPRCPWQVPEYYAREADRLTDSEFQRIHRNQWQQITNKFVPIEWWDACAVSDYAESGKLAVTVGMDAAVSGDCFAIVVTGRKNGLIQTRDVYLWTPPKDGKIIYSNPHDPNDLSTPEGVIRDLAQRYHVYEVAYDPYQLHDFASRLNAEGVVFLNPFEQGKARIIADKQLYDLIRDRNIQHRNHPDLNTHMNNAARKEEGEKLRIVKGTDETRKIDAVVALSMAAARAIYYGLG